MAGEATTGTQTWAGPLSGLRVIDLTRVLAGPYATQSLADLGAEVIKVEPPNGDETRHFPPFLERESHYFLALNRAKRSVVIDLKQKAGADLLRALAAKADILVENYRPGVMAKLGLSYEALSAENPGLIYCSISGFGQTGPLRDKPSSDIVTQAMSGALSDNGEAGRAPVKLGLPIGDMVGGVYGPIAVLARTRARGVDPLRDAAALGDRLRELNRCAAGGERLLQVALIDVGSSEVVFIGIFFEEQLLCEGMPPGQP